MAMRTNTSQFQDIAAVKALPLMSRKGRAYS
jgi:hypothetical protein